MLYTRKYGDTSKKPLILLHGFLGSYLDFKALVSYLQKHFFCICIDLPGFGRSPFNPNMSFNTFPDIFEEFLKSEKMSEFDLLGYSMGGRLALFIKKHFQTRCHKLTLIGSHTGLSSFEEKKTRKDKELYWVNLLRKEGLHNFLSQWYRQPLFKTLCSDKNKLNQMVCLRSNQNLQALEQYLAQLGLSQMENMENFVLSHQSDLTLIAGAKDTTFSKLYQKYHETNVSCHFIDNTSHAPHLENPYEVAQVLLNQRMDRL